MDNQPEQPQAQTPPPPPTPSEPQHAAGRSKWPFVALGLLILLVVAFVAGYFLMNQKKSETTAPAPTTAPQTEEEATSTPAPTEPAMKTYTSQKLANVSFSGYSLKHPADWVETVEKTDVSTKLMLTKEDYSISINQVPTEGSLCAYKDSDMDPNNPFISDKRGKPYVDLTTGIGALRRDQETGGNGEIFYPFCQKSDQDDSYGSFTKVGIIQYGGPSHAYDTTTLAEMDAIIKSIQTL